MVLVETELPNVVSVGVHAKVHRHGDTVTTRHTLPGRCRDEDDLLIRQITCVEVMDVVLIAR